VIVISGSRFAAAEARFFRLTSGLSLHYNIFCMSGMELPAARRQYIKISDFFVQKKGMPEK